jgi:hypothetical protein
MQGHLTKKPRSKRAYLVWPCLPGKEWVPEGGRRRGMQSFIGKCNGEKRGERKKTLNYQD